jgi:hypothetical protein
MSAKVRPDACHVRWDMFRLLLKSIGLPSDPFLSHWRIGVRNLNLLQNAKICKEWRTRAQATWGHTKLFWPQRYNSWERQIRRRWQKFRNREDKIELNTLTNLSHDKIRNFRLMKFEQDLQRGRESGSIWKLANRMKALVIAYPSKEGIQLYFMSEARPQQRAVWYSMKTSFCVDVSAIVQIRSCTSFLCCVRCVCADIMASAIKSTCEC